jgi:hypothetical protein
MSVDPKDIRRRFEALQAERRGWEGHWQEIAERVLPRQADFLGQRQPGAKRAEKIFDSTAPLALERFAAAMESMLTPRGQRWHHLRLADEEANRLPEVRAWLEAVEAALFAARYLPRANYASQQHEVYMALGAFGTAALFVGEDDLGGLRYRAIHLGELYVAEDAFGRIDTVFRRFRLSARQAAQMFGRAALPESLKRRLDRDGGDRAEFLHAVFPRRDRRPEREDARNMRYASVTMALDGDHILREGGFRTMPYLVGRYVTAPGEIYGRSPAMAVLPDIKMLNEAAKTIIRAAHRQVDPPILVHDDGVLGRFNVQPNAINVGAVSKDGRPLAIPFNAGARVDIGIEMLERWRTVINDAFLVTLFQVLADAPNMTATEALIRVQEKGALIAPAVGRQQSEMLGPMIAREIDILARQGKLPPAPPVIGELGAEAAVSVVYDSPLARARRAEDVTGLARALEAIAPFLRLKPELMEAFDAEAVAELALEAHGVPQRVLRSPAERRAAAEAARAADRSAAAPAMAPPGGLPAGVPEVMQALGQQIEAAVAGGANGLAGPA